MVKMEVLLLDALLDQVIRDRLYDPNPANERHYKGFDMSGYSGSNYSNLELLAKFSDLLGIKQRAGPFVVIPIFWKGVQSIMKVEPDKITLLKDMESAMTSAAIIKEIILAQWSAQGEL